MDIEKDTKEIKARNRRVEADKAWETSMFRKVLISVFTYLITAIVFYLIGIKDYLASALIPTIGYFLSIQSLPFIKKWWVENRYNK